MAQNRIRILTKSELHSLYGLPLFSDNERHDYLSLNDAENSFMQSLGSTASKVYFIVQLAYFKATTLFYPNSYLENKDDLKFIMKQHFQGGALPKAAPSPKTRKKIHDAVLDLTEFEGSKQKICPSIQSLLLSKVAVNVNPIYLFFEVLSHLQEEKMMLLGYSTLQDLISDAITTEQQRLCFILERNMTNKVELMLDRLLMDDGGLYALTALKKDPKSFRTKHIKAEIKKVHDNKKLYEFASRHLSKLKLTNQAIQYYASLADHYSIDRLRDLPKLHTQLYLICYVYYRYQQVVDNLVISFVYLTEKYYAEAKAMAKDIIFDEKIPVSSDSKQAAKVLEFYIDKSIPDNTTFGSVRQQAFKLLNEDKFSDVIQFIIGSLFDFERTCWDELSKNRSKITVNIRPIFKALNFACSSDDSTLLAGIQFLKKRFIDENNPEVPPVDCVPPKKRVYLTKNDDADIEMHRYEFMVYHLMKEQIESGQTFINDSVSFKNFSEYLIDDKRWKHKAKLLKELGYEHLLVPINEILKRHEEELEPLIKDINSRITNGANEGISIKKKGDEISWTLPYNKQAEKVNNPLFTNLPRIKIADLLHFVDRENHFMQAFTHIKPHHAKGDRDITAIIACLIANGTNLGVYKMADNCDLNYDRMQCQLKNYIRSETLQEANDIVSNAIADLPIFKYWDIHAERLHASVDGQKFGTRLHTFMARYSAKYFGIGKGVVAYTLSANHIPVNAKVISANQHESHFLFDILQNNTSDIDPDWVSGDGHSINQINFLLLDIIGKQFAPHFKRVKLKAQTLYGFKDGSDYQDYLIQPTNKVDKKLIESNWDDMLRVLVSLLLGEVSQHIIVSKLSSYKHKNKIKLALWELDKIIMSKYLLRYIDDPIIRQNVRRALNRGEAYHQLRRAIANVNGQKFRGASPQELEIWNDSARLLANCIIYYNAKMLSGLVTDLQTTMSETEIAELLAHISPIAWEHINLSGHYEFGEKGLEIDINNLVARLNIDAPGLEEAGYIPPKVADSLFSSLSG